MITGNIPGNKKSTPELTISCKNGCATALSVIQKINPRQLHFLRQICSCPENITGKGHTASQMAVKYESHSGQILVK